MSSSYSCIEFDLLYFCFVFYTLIDLTDSRVLPQQIGWLTLEANFTGELVCYQVEISLLCLKSCKNTIEL